MKDGSIMRTFAIKNDKHRKRPAQSWLYYDENTRQFSIKISRDVNINDLPFMLMLFAEDGIFEIDDKWSKKFVQSRIVPPERQNLGDVLLAHGLEFYDEFDFLMFDMGRCCQDDYYLEEVTNEEPNRPYSYLIADARKEAGLTQAELAKHCGIKQSNLSRLENGVVEPSLKTLENIAKALGKKLEIRFI